MKSGADGYILKKSSFNDLVKGIDEVLRGEAHLGKGLKLAPPKSLFKSESKKANQSHIIVKKYEDKYQIRQKLTKRELEILSHIVQTKNNKDIGKELYISEQTVGVHKKNIMRKLNVRNTIALIKYAVEQNLV
jgi:DNA-binding NarL/FixJ family response regulator